MIVMKATAIMARPTALCAAACGNFEACATSATITR
jgi:hypothetical protein